MVLHTYVCYLADYFTHFLAGSFVNLITTRKKVQSSGHHLECLGVPSAWIVSAGSSIKLQPEKKGTVIWPLFAMLDCFGGFVAIFFCGFLNQITNYNRKKGTVVWLTYTICNTRNILFLLCLYLKRGNKLNVGIVWFEGKAPS